MPQRATPPMPSEAAQTDTDRGTATRFSVGNVPRGRGLARSGGGSMSDPPNENVDEVRSAPATPRIVSGS